MAFHLGCAIWAYKGWVGDFYPMGSAPSQFLKLYSDRLTTVECNATFYSIPSAQTVQKWSKTVPSGFTFCPKFPRTISHEGKLQPHIAAANDFVRLMQILGPHLGPLFLQLPPSYSPTNLSDLAQFLRGLPTQSQRIAIEVRHPDWFNPPHHDNLCQLLQSLQVGQVLLDSRPMYEGAGNPQLTSQRKKPKVPLIPTLTAPFTLIRFISHPDLQENARFMETWMDPVCQWMQDQQDIYFFMHCPIEEHSPRHAKHFYQKLRDRDLPLPPLPWEWLHPAPAQLNLFA